MDGERSIARSCVIITTLVMPCIVIAFVKALVCVVKAFLCVVKKLCDYVQGELDLFNEIYEDNQILTWDKEGLFVAFIKGEDQSDRRQESNILRPTTENEVKATIVARINSGIAMTSTTKRPLIEERLLRDLLLGKSCDPLRVYSGIACKSNLPFVHNSQHCAKIDAFMSDSHHLATNENTMGANYLCAVDSRKDRSHETKKGSLCANREDHCQSPDSRLQVNSHDGASVPISQLAVLSQNSANKHVFISQEIERSSFRVDKKEKRGKTASVGSPNQVDIDQGENATSQETEHSPFNFCKDGKRGRHASVSCIFQVSEVKEVTSPKHERSSVIVNKEKKRSHAATAGCSGQTVAPVQPGKKPRKEPVAPLHRRKTPLSAPISKKMNKKKTSRKVPSSRVPNATLTGQQELVKLNKAPTNKKAMPTGGLLNANLPSQAKSSHEYSETMKTDQEPISVQNVELLNDKRPLPVTPFSVEPAEETMDMDQESLPATPSMTELVSLMEQLQIAPSEDPASDYVADVSDSDSDDDSDDAEYVLYPELQSLAEQVLQIIQLLA